MKELGLTLWFIAICLVFDGTASSAWDKHISKFCANLFHSNNGCDNFLVSHLCTTCHRRLRCLHCDNVDDPKHCRHSTHCGTNEVCATSETLVKPNFQKKYNLGCIDKTKCHIFDKNDHILGGSNVMHLPGGCCTYDNCNGNFSAVSSNVQPQTSQCKDIDATSCGLLLHSEPAACSNYTIAKHYCCQTCSHHFCDDIDSHVCQQLNTKIQLMCTDPCIASICKKSCNVCHGNSTSTSGTSPGAHITSTVPPKHTNNVNHVTSSAHGHSNAAVTPAQTSTSMTQAHASTSVTQVHTSTSVTHAHATTSVTQAHASTSVTQTQTGSQGSNHSCTQPNGTCPRDFQWICGNCYFFSNQPETWQDAQNICGALNAYLTELDTNDEEYYLHNYLYSKHGKDRHYVYWLGGKKDRSTSNWKWQQSTNVVHIDWWGKEDTSPGTDCLEYGPMWDYKMNNALCSRFSHFICELK